MTLKYVFNVLNYIGQTPIFMTIGNPFVVGRSVQLL